MQLKFIDHDNILYQATNMELLVSESSMAVNKLSFSNTATNIKWPLGLTLVGMEKVQPTITFRFSREWLPCLPNYQYGHSSRQVFQTKINYEGY